MTGTNAALEAAVALAACAVAAGWRRLAWLHCHRAKVVRCGVPGYLASRLDGLHIPAVGASAYRDPAAPGSNGPGGSRR